jgi:hypothetical protein
MTKYVINLQLKNFSYRRPASLLKLFKYEISYVFSFFGGPILACLYPDPLTQLNPEPKHSCQVHNFQNTFSPMAR